MVVLKKKMEENNSNEISRKLETMLPLDVFQRLTEFAKREARTGLGKFDYGVAIRILLNRAEIFELLNNLLCRIEILEGRVTDIENFIQNMLKNREEGIKTFGGEAK